MDNFIIKENYNYEDLLFIANMLRGEHGCPWDREQTHMSVRKNFVEEVYEAIEAIEIGDNKLMEEELGDVLFQVVFHAQMAKEEDKFTMDEVVDGICKKLVHRHPHVFSDGTASTSQQVLTKWDAIKKESKGMKTQTEVMKSISTFLPSLMRSYKIQQKAAKVGFDWDNIEGAYKKVYEEIEEVKEAQQENDPLHLEEEIGDMFFAMVNVARFLGVDPEISLNKTCEKFIKRFNYIENHAKVMYNRDVHELSLEEMDILWNECKGQDLQ